MEDAATPTAVPLRKRWWFRALMSAVRIVVLSAALLAIMARVFGDRFVFQPSRYPAGDWEAPSRSGLAFEDVWITAADGVRLHGWFVRAERSKGGDGDRAASSGPSADPPAGPKPLRRGEGPTFRAAPLTLLYFHGNAGNIAYRWDWIRALSTLPADVLAVDYRGYGRSEGEPSEGGVCLDAEAAYRYLTEERGVPASRLVIYGKSLGGAATCELAARFPCAGVILQSTFTSVPDMANEVVPLFPAGWFVVTDFDNLSKVGRIDAPKLVVHSRADEMVPYRMAERLYEAAAEPKELVTFEGSSHNGLVDEQRGRLIETFRRFLDRLESSGDTKLQGDAGDPEPPMHGLDKTGVRKSRR